MNSEFAIPQSPRLVKGLTGTPHADLSTWTSPDEGAIPIDKLFTYNQRKNGVELYLNGYSDEYIYNQCKIHAGQIYKLITQRCLATHPDGLIYGWRGLIPNLRIEPYFRKRKVNIDSAGKGGAGALQLLWSVHPELKARFDRKIFSSPSKNQLGPAKRPRKVFWVWFLTELRKLGLEVKGEWPFNTVSNGYYSICRYIDAIQKANPEKSVRSIGGPDLEKKLISGDGVGRPVDHIFQRVEMDAHKIDGIFCVLMPHASGGYVEKVIHRIWVIVIIEVMSRAVLGYHMSLNREVNKDDVLRTIKKALGIWQPRTLSFGDAYKEGAGFPANISDKFLRLCWDEMCVDGALAETSNHVAEVLKEVVGSTLVTPQKGFSSRRSKDDRPFIETFFRQLGTNGFQRLSNTTGGKPGGALGRDPAFVATNSRFQYEYAEELLDVQIANYNATLHSSLGYRTPLKYLEFISSKDSAHFRYADPNSVQGLLSYRKKCQVRGGLKSGKKPHVNFEGARYTSEVLSNRYDLIGSEIWVVNHLEDDARIVEASLLNGISLGILRVAPPWSRFPHSLSVRKAAQNCINRNMFSSRDGDAIEAFITFCEAQKNKKLPVHSKYLELRRILSQQSSIHNGEPDESHVSVDAHHVSALDQEETPSKLTQDILPARRMASIKQNG